MRLGIGVICALLLLVLPAGAAAATFEVTTRVDHEPNGCTSQDCTLREAVIAGNATQAAKRIVLPARKRPYVLTRFGFGEDQAAVGDLDLNDSDGDWVVVGAGAAKTVIDASGLVGGDRVFDVAATGASVSVQMSELTLTGGRAVDGGPGGAIQLRAGRLTLTELLIRGNSNQAGFGGGIGTDLGSALIVKKSTVRDNNATATLGGSGGGIAMQGAGRIEATTISGNDADHGGGMSVQAPSAGIRLANTTLSGNNAIGLGDAGDGFGGGMRIDNGAGAVELTNVTIAGNSGMSATGIMLQETPENVLVSDTLIGRQVGPGINCNSNQGLDMFDSLGDNLADDDICGLEHNSDLVVGNLRLAPLRANGGPTKTHALKKPSKARNTANCETKRDQRGVRRPQGPRCDIGAFERRRRE
jgi:hypothetical protein